MTPAGCFSTPEAIISMSPTHGLGAHAHGPERRVRIMAAAESVSTATRPADAGFKREMGLVGATWASETSIIGSGWLFAPLGAALLIGGAAGPDWGIARLVGLVFALLHA